MNQYFEVGLSKTRLAPITPYLILILLMVMNLMTLAKSSD